MVPPNGGSLALVAPTTTSPPPAHTVCASGWGNGSIERGRLRPPVIDAVVSGERYRLNDIITSDPCCIDQRDEEGVYPHLHPLPPAID
jgi:hypothetical protein